MKPDITHWKTDGIVCHCRGGHKVHVFIEVFGFLGNYPFPAQFLDVVKYMRDIHAQTVSLKIKAKNSADVSYTASMPFANPSLSI